MQVNIQTKITDEKHLQLLSETATKLARAASTRGLKAGTLNR